VGLIYCQSKMVWWDADVNGFLLLQQLFSSSFLRQ